ERFARRIRPGPAPKASSARPLSSVRAHARTRQRNLRLRRRRTARKVDEKVFEVLRRVTFDVLLEADRLLRISDLNLDDLVLRGLRDWRAAHALVSDDVHAVAVCDGHVGRDLVARARDARKRLVEEMETQRLAHRVRAKHEEGARQVGRPLAVMAEEMTLAE